MHAPAEVSALRAAARRCLAACDPDEKVALALALPQADGVASAHGDAADALLDPDAPLRPGRPERPPLVAPRALSPRGFGSAAGRATFLHAIAHIEFNAINLACDAVARFGAMPADFYRDWADVAADEARHFVLLRERLAQLGHAYGDFPAHDGLWDMAERTAHSCLARMALVPRVLEARGLDVTPAMIAKLRHAGDGHSADILELILREEVAHVAAGSRWFRWCCSTEGREPHATFAAALREHAGASLRGPFNHVARREAGFDVGEMEMLEAMAGAG